MLLSMLMLALAQEAAAPPIVADFKLLCLDTQGQAAAVTAAAAAQGGWGMPSRHLNNTIIVKTDGSASVVVGSDTTGGVTRQACSVRVKPGQTGLTEALPAALGENATAVDDAPGVYLLADSREAMRAGQVVFVSVATATDASSLTALRP